MRKLKIKNAKVSYFKFYLYHFIYLLYMKYFPSYLFVFTLNRSDKTISHPCLKCIYNYN